MLSWNLGEQNDAVLQQALSTQFSDAIERSIPAAGSVTLSGLDDGTYYFRAGTSDAWSNTITVDVEHHSLGRALGFFSLGLVLFIILISTIVLGNRVKGL